MADLGELNAKITADTSDFKKGMQEATGGMEDFSESTEQGARTTDRSMVKIGAAVAAATVAMNALVKEARRAIAAFEDNAQAETRLRAAIQSTGRAYEMSAGQLMDFTSELQGMTRFAGAETQAAMATLLTQFQDLDQQGLQRIMPLIQDFSTAMGVDLDRAAMMVGRTLGTSTNALTRYGIEIDMTTDSSERLEQVIGQLDSRFGGLAEEMGTTGAGAFVRLNNEMDDMRANAGSVIAEFLNPLILRFTDLASSVNAAYDAAAAFRRALAGDAAAHEIEEQIEVIRQRMEDNVELADDYFSRVSGGKVDWHEVGQAVLNGNNQLEAQIEVLEAQLELVREREQAEKEAAAEARERERQEREAEAREKALTELIEQEEEKRLDIREQYENRYARLTMSSLDYIEYQRQQALEQAKMDEVDASEEIELINQYYDELRTRKEREEMAKRQDARDRAVREQEAKLEEQRREEEAEREAQLRLVEADEQERLRIRERYEEQIARQTLDTFEYIEHQRKRALEQAELDHADTAEEIALINQYYDNLEQQRRDEIEQRNQARLDREEQQRRDSLDRQYNQLTTSLMSEQELHERTVRERIDMLDELAAAGYHITDEHYREIERLNEEHLERIEQQEREALDRKVQEYFRAGQRIAGDMLSIWSNMTESALRLEEQQALDHAKTEEEKAAITEKYGKKQFEANKNTATANTVMATANAAMEAYKVGAGIGGPILGATFASAAVAAGAAQVNNIRNQQWSGGGTVSPSPSAGGSETAGASRTIMIQGDFDSNQLFSGGAVRDLMDKISEAQRDGYKVVLA